MKDHSQNQPQVHFLKSIQELLLPLNWPPGSYIIAGSGPMAMRNMREAVDIDILVNTTLWNSLIQKYEATGATKNRIAIGRLEIWKDWMNLTGKIDEMIENCELIEGFPFMKLFYVIEWKQHLSRPKDLVDIAMIKDHLQKNSRDYRL
jgi:hypothetical protein